MTMVKRVAGVHSIYRPAGVGESVARADALRRPREQSGTIPGGGAGVPVRATGPQAWVSQ